MRPMTMKKELSITIGQYSTPGRKPINQDFHAILVPKEPQLSLKGAAIAIADGISSSDVSQVASHAAVNSFIEDYYCTPEAWSVKSAAYKVLKATNSWLYAQTQQSPNRFNKDKGYICTFSGLILKSNTAHVFHSGDSRIYRITNTDCEQLTSDHRRQVCEGDSYLTRGLGIHDHIEIDYQSISIQEGDIFVLATDGVYEYLSETAFSDVITQHPNDLNAAAKALVNIAYAEGSDDNLTLQIIKVASLPQQNLSELQYQFNNLQPAPKLHPRKDFEHYHILREIYISSRSHVYLAKNKHNNQLIALKTPSAEMKNNEQYLESFLMEDWIAQRINNTHVLKAIEKSYNPQYLYTATEYIEGQTLTQWMEDNTHPSLHQVRAIVEQIARGLQAFHRQEMVHQDLRPQNILIDESSTVKIIDFGATKVAGISEITPKNEGIVGTAQYTAPEYFLGHTGTNRSDLFSLGVITYQMLSGELPYGNNIAKTNTLRLQQRLTYRSLVGPKSSIPKWIDDAIKKATEIQPEKRYFEVSEFIHDLKQPSAHYLNKIKPPLIDRNPVAFWQSLSLVLFILLMYQLISDIAQLH